MIVLDASAVVDLLLATPAGRRVARRIAPADLSLHAPHVIDLEVAQTLRRYVQSAVIGPDRGQLGLRHLALLGLTRHPHDVMLPRIWALRENLTAYDAAYVSLAELLEAPLLTCDRRLARVPGSSARIEVVEG